jgi:hypothetical protein
MQERIFKVVLTLGLILLLTVVLYPVVSIAVLAKSGAWKYGFTFIHPSSSVALFGSFAIAFVVGSWHALSFLRFTQVPSENFLKTTQSKVYEGEINTEAVAEHLQKKGWEIKASSPDQLVMKARNRFFSPDTVTFRLMGGNKWLVQSRPFLKIIPVDMARNYKHLITAFVALRETQT